MKKSELKQLIRECLNEEIKPITYFSDDMRTPVKLWNHIYESYPKLVKLEEWFKEHDDVREHVEISADIKEILAQYKRLSRSMLDIARD